MTSDTCSMQEATPSNLVDTHTAPPGTCRTQGSDPDDLVRTPVTFHGSRAHLQHAQDFHLETHRFDVRKPHTDAPQGVTAYSIFDDALAIPNLPVGIRAIADNEHQRLQALWLLDTLRDAGGVLSARRACFAVLSPPSAACSRSQSLEELPSKRICDELEPFIKGVPGLLLVVYNDVPVVLVALGEDPRPVDQQGGPLSSDQLADIFAAGGPPRLRSKVEQRWTDVMSGVSGRPKSKRRGKRTGGDRGATSVSRSPRVHDRVLPAERRWNGSIPSKVKLARVPPLAPYVDSAGVVVPAEASIARDAFRRRSNRNCAPLPLNGGVKIAVQWLAAGGDAGALLLNREVDAYIDRLACAYPHSVDLDDFKGKVRANQPSQSGYLSAGEHSATNHPPAPLRRCVVVGRRS